MFQSVYFYAYPNQYACEIIDSDFKYYIDLSIISRRFNQELISITQAIIDEYSKRNLPVMENIALFNIWWNKIYNCNFEDIEWFQTIYFGHVKYKDVYCPYTIDKLIKQHFLLQ